jgi:hypothetical protein
LNLFFKISPYYHCCSRVVRRAFLCGEYQYTGENYDHRRGWVEAQILKLSKVFAIDVAAFAEMSNHLHVVLQGDTFQLIELIGCSACYIITYLVVHTL